MLNSVARATERFDEIRSALRWADPPVGLRTPTEQRVAGEIVGGAFVAVCGTVEQFYREFARWLASHIDSRGVGARNLRTSLHSLVSTTDFRSLQQLRDPEKVFAKRIELLDRTVSALHHALTLDSHEFGFDGESIRPRHIANLWSLFGLPGQPFENIHQRVALGVVADNRNDYAHGNIPLHQFLQNPECTSASLLQRIDAIEGWFFHCWAAETEYFTNRGYRR